MFNLLQFVSDDQTALGACIFTLAGAALFVAASFHLGPAGQRFRNRECKDLNAILSTPASIEADRSRERAA